MHKEIDIVNNAGESLSDAAAVASRLIDQEFMDDKKPYFYNVNYNHGGDFGQSKFVWGIAKLDLSTDQAMPVSEQIKALYPSVNKEDFHNFNVTALVPLGESSCNMEAVETLKREKKIAKEINDELAQRERNAQHQISVFRNAVSTMAQMIKDHEYVGHPMPWSHIECLDDLHSQIIELHNEISRLKKTPDGYALVPVEPTLEMRTAFHEANDEWQDGGLDAPDHQWAAMLAAASSVGE